MKVLVAASLFVASFGAHSQTVYLSGDSSVEDTVVVSLVNLCQSARNAGDGWQAPASARVYTFTPDALPANLGAKGGIHPLGNWSVGNSDFFKSERSHQFVVACNSKRFGGADVVSVNLMGDVVSHLRLKPMIFLTATYDGVTGQVQRLPNETFTSFGGAAYYLGDPSPMNDVIQNVRILFGVAVSPDLYHALQQVQGISVLPGEDERLQKYQPNIWRSQYVSVISDAFNSAKTDASSLFGVAAGKLTVCRFVKNSGAQSASDEYFLNSYVGSDGVAAGALLAAGSDSYGENSGLISYEVKESNRAYDVRKCLSGPGYAIGVLPLENMYDRDPQFSKSNSDRLFRFVRINSVSPLDFVFESDPSSGKSFLRMVHPNLKGGLYDFVYAAGAASVGEAGGGLGQYVDAGWARATFDRPGMAPPSGTTSAFSSGFWRSSPTAPLSSWP